MCAGGASLAMTLMVDVRGAQAREWHATLAAAVPEAEVVAPGEASIVDYLAAWRPRADLFAGVRVTRAIFNLGAGVDVLLAHPGVPPDVPVYRLVDAGMGEQMAEYAVAAVLRAFRELDAYAAAQAAGQWTPRPRRDKASFGVGVLGLGVLGRAVLGALAPFGFPRYGYARRVVTIPGVRTFAGDDLDAFLRQCHVCICLAPLTGATGDLFDRARLACLPRGAHLVNLARGELVVDEDLVAALDEGHLAGATLDVFREEPLPATHPFWHHPKVTLTPHVSAQTLIEPSAAQVAGAIRAIEAGREPPGRVDRQRGY